MLLFVPIIFVPGLLYSHDPITTKLTWTQEISRVVYKRCAGCHRPDGKAFSLLAYEDARPWAKAIRDQVRTRAMPPWGPVKGVGEFRNDVSLSEPEIEMLVGWVEGGAPEGEPQFLPAAPRAAGEAVTRRFRNEIRVASSYRPKAAIRVAAISIKAAGEIWITRADGTTERLLWIKEFPKYGAGKYVLRTPVAVNPGDVLHATSPVVISCSNG